MLKPVKITLITLSSLISLLLITVLVACLIVFTPKRLTQIIEKEAPNFITCQFDMQRAELTLFKTFPHVGVDIQGVTLLNPMFGSPSDTLLCVEHCTASLNLRELVKNKHIVLRNLLLKDGFVNLFTNDIGQSNWNVFISDTTKPSSEFNYSMDLQKIVTQNVHVKYTDLTNHIAANLQNVDIKAKGKWLNQNADGKINLSTDQLTFCILDSSHLKACYEKLNFKFKGNLEKMDNLNGNINLNIKQLSFSNKNDKYIDSTDIKLSGDVIVSLKDQSFSSQDLQLSLNQYKLRLYGTAKRNAENSDIDLNLNYETKKSPVQEVLAIIPQVLIGDLLNDIKLDGQLGLKGDICGHVNDTLMPIITATVDWQNGAFSMTNFPFELQKINTLFNVNVDLNDQTDVAIHQLDFYIGRNHVSGSGNITDLLDKMTFDVAVSGDLHLADFKELFPEALTHCDGKAQGTLNAKFTQQQLSDLAIDQMTATGHFHLTELDLIYDDSLTLQSPSAFVDFQFPINQHPYEIGEWAEAKIRTQQLSGSKIGLGSISTTDAHIDAFVNNLMDSTQNVKLGTTFQFSTLAAKMDTIDVLLKQANGTFSMKEMQKLTLKYAGESLLAHYGQDLTAYSEKIAIDAKTSYDKSGYNPLLQWNPSANLKLKNGTIESSRLGMPLDISTIDMDFNMQECNIQEGSCKLGNSNLTLSGKILNIDKYFLGRDLLSGNLELVSNYIDINEIMDLVNGFGAPDSLLTEEAENKEDNPFIVPHGIDIRMHTLIKKAHVEEIDIRNIGGYLSVKDGVLVLDEMGFTSDAARMQLTAMYKTPRKNHLFLGLDFHLLDIKIAELINMIPQVDTILPMLSSFAGNAEFHFAAETYLKSNYDLKYSTLRGAAAINAKDLVVLDNNTYRKISKLLMFKKGTENRIDSLSAEMTIYKNEVDVYPFSVSIDKYQAILSGRHKLDMTYDYNISLIKPIRLGLDISGHDKRKFKVGKAKYATLFKPEKQNVVEQNVMQLKNQINSALRSNVREQPSEQHQSPVQPVR